MHPTLKAVLSRIPDEDGFEKRLWEVDVPAWACCFIFALLRFQLKVILHNGMPRLFALDCCPMSRALHTLCQPCYVPTGCASLYRHETKAGGILLRVQCRGDILHASKIRFPIQTEHTTCE